MKDQGVLCRCVSALRHGLVLGAMVLVVAGPVWATNVSVDCGAGGSVQTALDGLDLIGPHTITVTGTCADGVSIIGHDRVTIESSTNATIPGFYIEGSRRILLRGLHVTADVGIYATSEVGIQSCTVQNAGFAAVDVEINSEVHLSGTSTAPVVLSNNENGIIADASVLSIEGFVTIENNAGEAINIEAGRGALIGLRERQNGTTIGGENIIRNNGLGISVHGNANLDLFGQNLVQNNGDFGFQVFDNGSLGIGGNVGPVSGLARATTIENHAQAGIFGFHGAMVRLNGPHKVRNNGTANGAFRAGVGLKAGSTMRTAGAQITNNTGPGILADGDSSIRANGLTVTGNTEPGVKLTNLSSMEGLAPNTMNGNGTADLSCDGTSVAYGDLSGIAVNKCGGGKK